MFWGVSLSGQALRSHRRDCRFESDTLHYENHILNDSLDIVIVLSNN